MPFLPTVFTLLERYDGYFVAAVDLAFSMLPRTIETHVERTRRIAAAAAATLVREPLDGGAAAGSVIELIERYNDANARSLLITTPLAGVQRTAARVMEAPLPQKPADGTPQALLADIRACHGDVNLPGFWRELADAWPGLADHAWPLVRAAALDHEFTRARDAILALATRAVGGPVAPAPEELGAAPPQAAEIAEILAWYQLVIPTMVVEIECLRHALTAAPGQ